MKFTQKQEMLLKQGLVAEKYPKQISLIVLPAKQINGIRLKEQENMILVLLKKYQQDKEQGRKH